MSVRTTSRHLAALAAGTALALAALGGVQPAAAAGGGGPVPSGAPRFSSGSDAITFVSPTAATSTSWRNGNKVTLKVAPASSKHLYAGQFSGLTGGDTLIYNPGTAGDGILHLAQSGTSITPTYTPFSVSGSFQPIIGDFDGNLVDDIVWYAPGSGADFLWRFAGDGSHTQTSLSIGGSYKPIVLDANGDSREDILWYGPGSIPDSLWLFDASAGHTSKALSIGGASYRPVVGPFGNPAAGEVRDRVLFFNPSGPDYQWVFDGTGTPIAYSLPNLDGDYRPLVGQFIEEAYGTVFFYGPGALKEHLWAFGPIPGDVSEETAAQVTGTYDPKVGDFDANELSDIVWTGGTSARLWRSTLSGTPIQSTISGIPIDSVPSAVEMD